MPLNAVRLKDLSRVGGKAANLGEFIAAGLPVPHGFVVTTDACKRFLQSDPRIAHCLETLVRCSPQDVAALRAAVRELRQELSSVVTPGDVADAIAASLASGTSGPWAVRSSATVEDMPEASFAGQHDSFLNVSGYDAVATAVKRCWLSLFSERAITYRIRKGIAPGGAQMAVIVQVLIPADAAGVMFTNQPAHDDSRVIFIEAAFGLGEGVVQGKVTPDRITVSRSKLAVVRRDTSVKQLRIVATKEGVCEQPLHGRESTVPVLDDETAVQLARFGLKAERLFGMPQDIEWARHEGKLFLLQSRPITGKVPFKTWEDRQLWSNLNSGEILPDVITPITWSLWQSLAKGTAFPATFRLLGADVRRAPLLGLVAGRLYFNVNTFMAAIKPFSFLLASSTPLFQAIGGGPAEAYRRTQTIPPEDLPDLGFRWPKYILSLPRILYDLFAHLPHRGEAWLALLKAQIDELVSRDVETMSSPQMVRLCVEMLREPFKDVDLLFLVTPAAMLPIFLKACRDWLSEPDPVFAYRLFSALGGLPTAEAGLALWRLAVLAQADRDTEVAVNSGKKWSEVCAHLQHTEPGRRFLTAWAIFMTEHGHHCRGELELFNARWSEMPDYILGVMRGYLHSIGQSDPLENQRQLAVEREKLREQCQRRLKNPVKRWLFSCSLRRAQKLAIFREQLKNEGVRQFAFTRRLLLILGQRLQEQGILSCRDDIFFLEIAEIEPVATGNAPYDWRARIEKRRREHEQNLKFSPPSLVVGKFNPSAAAWPATNLDAKRLEGIAASPGVVTGPARVILRADDHEQVLPGEILVAPFTDPAWSPYFINAAGLVVEQGGILSHGSIVAREYGIPAVVNVGSATKIIQTGQWLEVDADRGVVRVLDPAPETSANAELRTCSRAANQLFTRHGFQGSVGGAKHD